MIVNGTDKLLSLTARGKMGFTSACGFARCSNARCGATKLYGGVYQKKNTLKGPATSRMRMYRPTNPQTETQQAWRDIFAMGWVEWALLTTEEKVVYNKQAKAYRLSGPQLFMKNWLRANLP